MKTWITALGLLLACVAGLASAQEAAGTLKNLRGQASLERDGVKRALRGGETLLPKDRIITSGDGYATVGFVDQSSLAIGPNSDVDLSKYKFNPVTHQGEQQVRLRAGSLASISGKIAKASPESVQFNAGSVTLGVRGTQFVAEVQSGASQEASSLRWNADQQMLRNDQGLCWRLGTGEGGCPVDRYVLLPDRDGKVGAIVVNTQGRTFAVKEAYSGVEIEKGTARNASFSENDIRGRYQDLLTSVPPGPRTFVLYFDSASSGAVSSESLNVVAQINDALRHWPVLVNVDVVGHTDTEGRADKNEALSLQRAKAVSRMLDSSQLSAERLQVSGRGERQLLVPTPDEKAEPRNRRVEVTLH